MGLFDHVQIKVSDFPRSCLFYDAIMSALGYKVVLDIDKEVRGYGTSPHDMVEIRQATIEAPLSKNIHVAFRAKSPEHVRTFFNIAMEMGGRNHGEPGYRDYEDGYYAAFVLDPDGHNIEAVYGHHA